MISEYGGLHDPLIANRVAIAVENFLTSRASLMKKALDPRRNINDECGYPDTEEIDSLTYKELYDRESIATRVVEVLPKECWQMSPAVFETEDVDQETEFEAAWKELGKSLQGDSHFKAEEANPVWPYLLRADILSGIGHYGVLLLGIDDGKPLEEPLEPGDNRQLTFLRVFDETIAKIVQFEVDIMNPRYGKPVMYSLDFTNPQGNVETQAGAPTVTKKVHWTRVIHIADDLGSSEIFAVPRQRPVWNRLLDLRKLYAGSAEMYWKGAFMGLSLETHPQLGGDVDIDEAAMRSQIEKYQNGLQRFIATVGMAVKPLAPQVVDPTPQIDAQIKAICIKIGCPKRVFEGSERGELSSSQDDSAWNDRLRHRQAMYVTPRIIVPFVDRCISVGVLPEPLEGFGVKWPDLDTLTVPEQAAVAVQLTEAMAKYVGGGVENIIDPTDFLVRILGLERDEVEAIIEKVMESEDDPLTMPSAEEDADDKEFERGMQQKELDVKAASKGPGK